MAERHAEIIKQAEALVFVYPTWWSTMPAILKGWLERVLVPGVGFVFDEQHTCAARPHASAAHRRDLDIRLAEAVREGNPRQRSAHLAARTQAQHGDPHTPVVARACTNRQLHRCQRVPRSCGESSGRCDRCERIRRLLPSRPRFLHRCRLPASGRGAGATDIRSGCRICTPMVSNLRCRCTRR